MSMLKGIGASAGVAVAELVWLEKPDLSVTRREGLDPAAEKARYDSAAAQALSELDALYERACETDEATAQVFDIHRMMLDDPDFCEGVAEALEQGVNAEWAIWQTAEGLADMFRAMEGDDYMQARAADVQDVSQRLIRILKGIRDGDTRFDRPVIVAAADLLPSQTVRLDKEKVVGFVTKYGSATSHSAILARTLGIPCIVGMGEDFDQLGEGGTAAIDGTTGQVVLNPNEEELAEFQARQRAYRADQSALEGYKEREAVTSTGHKVLVVANIGGLDDIDAVTAHGGDGVGLFRSEFIYLNSADFPTEEEQFLIYKEVLERLAPRPVVVRTLDLGSDKQAPYFGIEGEENPAMGYRAIRICLKEPHIFRTQMRALLRASVYGNLNVMFPMITQLGQARKIKELLAEIQQELEAEGIPFSRAVQYGIMIETPAAAVMSDVLAREVDFFSIGTNDLTQYTMAADRMNARISDLFDPADPAVLRLMKLTAQNAHAAGIWVGICGESAANTALTNFYMDIGIDELSVSPASIPAVKRAVIESNPESPGVGG
ncbi:MAG: phosphoenolpyruvate--protein phosphotransferase [Oscillospiraceae bacterium]|nr:phosphoenolpyruvate--protein phosphotransferase [Oscillospiraceae bacterium]